MDKVGENARRAAALAASAPLVVRQLRPRPNAAICAPLESELRVYEGSAGRALLVARNGPSGSPEPGISAGCGALTDPGKG
jgi:hypothetical protein